MSHVGPIRAREVLDRLEAEILPAPEALVGQQDRLAAPEGTAPVPSSVEPPD